MGNNPPNGHIGTLPPKPSSSKHLSTASSSGTTNNPTTLHLNLVVNGNMMGTSTNSSPIAPGYKNAKSSQEAAIGESLESQTMNIPNEITVMSFSIRRDSVFDGINQWKNRRETITNIILESKADIIAVQDGLQHQILDLFTLLNERQERSQYLWFGLGQNYNHNTNEYSGEYITIFYNAEKIELLDQGCFWYSYSPSTKGSRSWDAVAPRLCTWCKFRNIKSSKQSSFHVFNTHWDIGVEARRNSAYLIREYIENLTCDKDEENQIIQRPCIVMGNLNCLPDSNAVHLLSTGIDLGAKNMDDSNSDDDTASDGSNCDSDDEEESFKLISADPNHHPTFVGLNGDGLHSSSSSCNTSTTTPSMTSNTNPTTTTTSDGNVNSFSYPQKIQGKCTDYIFVSPNIQVLDFRAITEVKCKNTGRNASDHLPIMAALLV
ncbi:hypothetical protein FDP41_010624 [Naegleria fowleri]|uniref:Endonuclease/exonuclease/phosphatase domain-containing protein n=1 Tax=Naegleria fowleri TaxID=5763 RepID=A0A6A5CE32_NAEFO|nr:uncharacterized protein FDP41_010624 [Naegleria fowleri]KAF0983559.1 hypothetical protein FDP41_010624 [Naegleria fowleri]CAG4713689.1 unnamed protein product [Naegleria fowleri]